MTVTVRRAVSADEPDVIAFTRETWPDRGDDYLPRVFTDWVTEDDGETRRTFVADADGTVVGVLRCVLLSDREAWMQGMRVAPAVRGEGISRRLHDAAAGWARARGASVARIMVFSWNAPALGSSRALGFAPVSAFRWIHPEPVPAAEPEINVGADPDDAWRFWRKSAARHRLGGLALAPELPWALRELTPATVSAAGADDRLAVVRDGVVRGFAFRVRDRRRTDDDGEAERVAEYGVAAWADPVACESLLAAIGRDAATVGADRTRVLVPESVEVVSDAALAGATVAEQPDYVLEFDLTDAG